MMQYLGIIEQRTNEILQMYAACQPGQGGADQAMMQNSNQQRKYKQRPKIEIEAPPCQEKEVQEEDETGGQPLTKNEMRDRAMKRILASRKK